MRLLPLVLYSQETTSDGYKPLLVNQSLLPFEIEVESKKTWEIEIDGYNYSHAGMRIHLHRIDLGLLMGGFYLPMALFSTLSLISFTINPEVVSLYVIVLYWKFQFQLQNDQKELQISFGMYIFP